MRQYQTELMKLAIQYSEMIDYCEEGMKLFPSACETYRMKKMRAVSGLANTMTELVQSMEQARPEAWTNLETINESVLA